MNQYPYVPPEGPPQDAGPSKEIYVFMGEDNIFKMLEDFYRELERSEIRHLFPEDMVASSKKSGAYFVWRLGGPPLYHQRHGPPMMRARHMPFPIDEHARQVWLACFDRVLEQGEECYHFPPQHLDGFKRFLREFSAWMVNTA